MNRAPCWGKSALFLSADRASHAIAVTYCHTCPVIDFCREQRDRRDPGGNLQYLHGTWAGELWSENHLVTPGGRVPRERSVAKFCADCGEAISPFPANKVVCSPCRAKRKQESWRRSNAKRVAS